MQTLSFETNPNYPSNQFAFLRAPTYSWVFSSVHSSSWSLLGNIGCDKAGSSQCTWDIRLLKLFFLVLIYFWETESISRGETYWGTEDPKQALHWHQWVPCGAQTHEPRDHDLSQSQTLNHLSHPGAPWIMLFIVGCLGTHTGILRVF